VVPRHVLAFDLPVHEVFATPKVESNFVHQLGSFKFIALSKSRTISIGTW